MGEPRAARAASIAELRALADLLESEPSLPMPTVYCACYMPRLADDGSASMAEVFAAAEKLGTEVVYDRREGRVETTWKLGNVEYMVYTRVPKPQAPADTVVVASPEQVLNPAATIRRPAPPEPEHVSTVLLREAAEPLRNGEQFPVETPDSTRLDGAA